MGVHKLTKYAKDQLLYEKVDMREVASAFRSGNAGDPVIIVDGSECAWYLYGKMDSLHGGQYKEFRERCEWFVKQFRDMGFTLFFYFYGVPVEYKASSWLKDRQVKTNKIRKFFTKLRAALAEGDSDIGNPSRLLPQAVVPLATVTFKQLGCAVRLSTSDRDTEMAQFAASNRCCVGVLSNNSDFMIYEGVPCLFTLNDLDAGKKAFSDLTIAEKVTVFRFRSVDIASHLGIEVRDLPAFASFVGNRIVQYETLQGPHKKLTRIYGHQEVPKLVAGPHKKSTRIYGHQEVPKLVAVLLNECRGDLEKMCEVTFGSKLKERLELIQKSVRCYRCEVEEPVPDQNTSEWDAVLRHVKTKHVSCEIPAYVFTVMKYRVTRCGVGLEDLSESRPDSPPTGLVVRGMLARMYTVLLWDSGPGPFLVTEDIQTGLKEVHRETVVVQKMLPEELDHPGLLELWSEADDTRRWRIFTWVISPAEDLLALRALSPQHLAVPAVALFYLYHHKDKILTEAEVKIFLIVAVSVKNFSGRQLSGLCVKVPTERAIYLATLYVHTALCVLDAAGACGLSFPRPAECHLDAYFDGKLFHHVYNKSQHTSDRRALTEWDELCEETFCHLMNIIGIQSGTTS